MKHLPKANPQSQDATRLTSWAWTVLTPNQLPHPHNSMTADEKGALFLRYVRNGLELSEVDGDGYPYPAYTFSNANLVGADLRGRVLYGADLRGADLTDANLQGAQLIYVNLAGASLQGADLRDVVLRETNMAGVNLRIVLTWRGGLADHTTYRISRWDSNDIEYLRDHGLGVLDVNQLSIGSLRGLFRSEDGLTLYFRTQLAPVDRVLIDAVIHSIHGSSSACRLTEYAEACDSIIVRIEGSRRDDLEAVAEALYHRVWELQDRAQRATLAQLAQALTPQTVNVNASVGTQIIVQNATFGLHADLAPVVDRLQKLQDALGASLSDLVDRLERMELRLPSVDAAADQTAAAAARRELKLVRTWDPGTHPRTALDRLLAMLEPDELRLLLARGPDGAKVVTMVPAGALAPMVIASQAADELVRRGLVDQGFFERVVAARPDLEEQVRKVAGMWSGPSAGPELARQKEAVGQP